MVHVLYPRVKNGQARITVISRLLGVVRTCVDKRSSIGGGSIFSGFFPRHFYGVRHAPMTVAIGYADAKRIVSSGMT